MSAAIFNAVLDTLAAARWTRHLFIDAEREGDGWAIVVRGDDKTKAGGDAKKPPAFVWNDQTGQARRFIVAMYDNEADALKVGAAFRTFYASEGMPFSQRLAPVAECGESAITIALMLASVLQAGANPHANSSSHWAVSSINDTANAKRLAREKKDRATAVASITAALNDPAAFAQLADSIQSPEEIAALAAIVEACRRNLPA